jgi:hypothetical protein
MGAATSASEKQRRSALTPKSLRTTQGGLHDGDRVEQLL